MLLADKVIVITGAAGGIGRALAHARQRSLDINLMAHIPAARACLPGMLQRGEGYFLPEALQQQALPPQSLPALLHSEQSQ